MQISIRRLLPAAMIIIALTAAPQLATAQHSGDIRLGIGTLTGAADLGQVNAGTARHKSQLAVGFIWDMPFEFVGVQPRVTATAGLNGSMQINPTENCLYQCDKSSYDQVSIWSAGIGVMHPIPLGSSRIELDAGVGVRSYKYGSELCACEPPPPSVDPSTVNPGWPSFHQSQTAMIGRLGVGLRLPIGSRHIWFSVADQVSRSMFDKTQHDVLMMVGLGLSYFR